MTVNCDFVNALLNHRCGPLTGIIANHPSEVSLLVHHSIILYNVHADVTVNYLRFRDLQFVGRAHDGTVCARNGE